MELTFSPVAPGRGRGSPLAGYLHRGRFKTPDWNTCILSIGRPKNFMQLSFGQTGNWKRKDAHFKVLCGQIDERGAVHVVEGSCIDEIYDALAKRLLPTAAAASNSNLKYLVGLAGPPGAGKSTVAHEVVNRINKLWPEKSSALDSQVKPSDVATVVPMDGFHLYRFELDAMEDPQEAHARRGAPWTFNPSRLLSCLKNLRSQGSVYAPSFDHGVGDPVEDDIFVNLQHKVVIVEGNYLLLEDGVWKELSSLFDEKWFIDVDIEKAMQRVLKRHISTGKPPDVAKYRIEYNDRPNAELIMKSKKNADLVINERIETLVVFSNPPPPFMLMATPNKSLQVSINSLPPYDGSRPSLLIWRCRNHGPTIIIDFL